MYSPAVKKYSKSSGISKNILQKVYNRGIGAWYSSPRSVRSRTTGKKNVPRSQRMSKEQWATARVKSFVKGSKKHDQDLRQKLGDNTSLRYPVKDFNVTSPYGTRVHPVLNIPLFHSGVDIGIPVGTVIRSQADGVVKKVFIAPKGGLQLKIKYKNGYTSGFAHLKRVLVGQNQTVSAGEPIALSGGDPNDPQSGLSTAPHLHYTLRNKDGNLIDPLSINYQPYRNNQILAGMPGIPFQSPITYGLLIIAGIIASQLMKK